MSQRSCRIVMLVGLLGFSWPLALLVHESGHAMGAVMTGGHVVRMVWHPLVLSRTDVDPNPRALVVVWAGPIFGAIVPVAIAICVSAAKLSVSYIVNFFAGFCLLLNGTYIGVGTLTRVGDAKDMLRLGSPMWVGLRFGAVATICGLWLVNRVSPRLGFGNNPQTVRQDHAYAVLGFAILLCVVGFVFGNQG